MPSRCGNPFPRSPQRLVSTEAIRKNNQARCADIVYRTPYRLGVVRLGTANLLPGDCSPPGHSPPAMRCDRPPNGLREYRRPTSKQGMRTEKRDKAQRRAPPRLLSALAYCVPDANEGIPPRTMGGTSYQNSALNKNLEIYAYYAA